MLPERLEEEAGADRGAPPLKSPPQAISAHTPRIIAPDIHSGEALCLTSGGGALQHVECSPSRYNQNAHEGDQMKKLLISATMLLAVTSCAKRPDAIVPVDIPMGAYTGESCEGLARELVKEQQNLAAVSKEQNQAATGDAVGVFMLGVPVSSTFGGDKEGQVAVAKGKVQAIENARKSKGCK